MATANFDLKSRTEKFAHRCVKLSLTLGLEPLSDHIKKQLIRCSTSLAANYRAACVAQSKASFVSKLSIAIEEADESFFWMQFIIDEHLIEENMVQPLLGEAKELTAILIASRKTAKNRALEFITSDKKEKI